jgi:hypothetical protein
VQHAVEEMHVFEAVQMVSPVAQAHVPPGAAQVSPFTGQSVSTQHVPVAMQRLVVGVVHGVSPVGQAQVPPGVGQVSPFTVQLVLSQQLVFGMHVLNEGHTVWSAGQAHFPPGAGHVSPMEVQSMVEQHSPGPAHPVLPGQTVWPFVQCGTHSPSSHSSLALQTLPQTPQFLGSVPRLAQ